MSKLFQQLKTFALALQSVWKRATPAEKFLVILAALSFLGSILLMLFVSIQLATLPLAVFGLLSTIIVANIAYF